MKPSSIGWCDYSGGTLNYVSGCTPVSEGCANCYARAIYKRYGKDFDTVVCDEDKLRAAMKYHYRAGDENPRKRGEGTRPICFVCDTGDLFHPDVPKSFIFRAFLMMGSRPDVDWMILTKRPERLREFDKSFESKALLPWNHIYLGVTCENQARADERIPILLQHWAGPKFVSVEPMLEDMTIQDWLWGWRERQAINWVICGAESGPNRRLFDVKWAEHLYRQCQMEDVPMFGKQDSGLYPGTPLLIDGKIIHEWPGVPR